MDGEEDFWVLELGISRPGDMDDLGYILAPDAALVVNIGPCHLEGLGSLAGVAREKSTLLDYVRPDGFACVGADYPALRKACTSDFQGQTGLYRRAVESFCRHLQSAGPDCAGI